MQVLRRGQAVLTKRHRRSAAGAKLSTRRRHMDHFQTELQQQTDHTEWMNELHYLLVELAITVTLTVLRRSDGTSAANTAEHTFEKWLMGRMGEWEWEVCY